MATIGSSAVDWFAEQIRCPITQDAISNPYVTACGHLFDGSENIRTWIQKNPVCPTCKTGLSENNTVIKDVGAAQVIEAGRKLARELDESTVRSKQKMQHLQQDNESKDVRINALEVENLNLISQITVREQKIEELTHSRLNVEPAHSAETHVLCNKQIADLTEKVTLLTATCEAQSKQIADLIKQKPAAPSVSPAAVPSNLEETLKKSQELMVALGKEIQNLRQENRKIRNENKKIKKKMKRYKKKVRENEANFSLCTIAKDTAKCVGDWFS